MTDLALSDEQEALRASARAFLRRACTPELVRRARAPDGDGHDVDLWQGMARLGWLGLAFPESIGGGGGGLLDLAVLYEEAGRVLVPTTLYSTTALQCVEMVGGARAVLDLTVRYTTDRAQFGRPIGSFQAVQHHVADLSTRIDAAALAAWQAVWCCSPGGVPDAAVGDADARVSIAKVAAGHAYVETTLMAHQLHGAVGFTVDHDLHLWSDRARASALTFGSRQDHLRVLGSLVTAR